MKLSITATIDERLLEWIVAESKRRDGSRLVYRNRSQLIENMLELGKKDLLELEKE